MGDVTRRLQTSEWRIMTVASTEVPMEVRRGAAKAPKEEMRAAGSVLVRRLVMLSESRPLALRQGRVSPSPARGLGVQRSLTLQW